MYSVAVLLYESRSMLLNPQGRLGRAGIAFRNLSWLFLNHHSLWGICRDWCVWNTVSFFHTLAYTSVVRAVVAHSSHIVGKLHLVRSGAGTKILCMDLFLWILLFLNISLCCTFSLPVGTTAFQKGIETIYPYQTGIRHNHIACSGRILPASEYDWCRYAVENQAQLWMDSGMLFLKSRNRTIQFLLHRWWLYFLLLSVPQYWYSAMNKGLKRWLRG